MIKLLIKSILFSVLVFLCIRLTERYFIKEDRFNNSKFQYQQVIDTSSIDLIFYGSSKSYCSYNPTIFKNKIGVNSYNLAGQGQVLEITDFVINETALKMKPKLVVVDLSYKMITFDKNDSLAQRSKSYQLKIIDNFKLSLNKLSLIDAIYNKDQLTSIATPLVRNHESWNEVFRLNYKKEFLEERNNLFLYNNGYIGTLQNMDDTGKKFAKDMNLGYDTLKNKFNLKVSESEFDVIKKIHKQCTENNISVLFVTAPSIQGYVRELSYYEHLEQLCKDNGMDYLNLNKDLEAIGITPDDFKDIQHMNYSGGYKTSKFLSKYILEKYSFNEKQTRNSLDNNVTYHMLSKLKFANTLFAKDFNFNNGIKLNTISYFKESGNRYAFMFKLDRNMTQQLLDNHRGYLRYYIGEINDANKEVNSFPLTMIEVENDKYIFARINIDSEQISKFDLFFLKKGSSQSSNLLSIKDLNIR